MTKEQYEKYKLKKNIKELNESLELYSWMIAELKNIKKIVDK